MPALPESNLLIRGIDKGSHATYSLRQNCEILLPENKQCRYCYLSRSNVIVFVPFHKSREKVRAIIVDSRGQRSGRTECVFINFDVRITKNTGAHCRLSESSRQSVKVPSPYPPFRNPGNLKKQHVPTSQRLLPGEVFNPDRQWR